MRFRLQIAVAAALGASVIFVASPAQAAAGHFEKISSWSGGYAANFTIHNHTTTPITGWLVQFCLPAGTRVVNGWNTQLTQTGDCYSFRSLGWNGELGAGASTSFGFTTSGTGEPINCTVGGEPCAGLAPPTDLSPPTAPGNLHIVWNPGVTLVWEASTDDRGVVGYEIFESGTRLTTVTATSHVYSTTNAIPPKLYEFGVRAVDAAGNISPYDFVPLGPSWSTTAAPSAPAGLTIGEQSPATLTLTWQASTRIPYSEAPVAGYEVSVDGAVVARVGGTIARLATPAGTGPHVFTVRGFNAVGLFSPAAQTTATVDHAPGG